MRTAERAQNPAQNADCRRLDTKSWQRPKFVTCLTSPTQNRLKKYTYRVFDEVTVLVLKIKKREKTKTKTKTKNRRPVVYFCLLLVLNSLKVERFLKIRPWEARNCTRTELFPPAILLSSLRNYYPASRGYPK